MSELSRVRVWADALITAHLDDSWSFGFDSAKRRAGLCDYSRKRISVSRYLAARYDDDTNHQTLLHEVARSDWERVHLLFRDYLRSHSAVAGDYADLKRRLAGQHHLDPIAYNDEKGPWIEETLGAAEEWARATTWRP